MNASWIIAPILLPAVAAPLLILLRLKDHAVRRGVSVAASVALLAIAAGLYGLASDGQPRAYLLGAWEAPFGIVLVLDRLSATMVLLTAILALLVNVYACAGWDRRGKHFHSLFQFQLMGINGAFLTGDVFNLFVFFEVMLIASYGLMLHGGGARRITAGFQYVAINLLGSVLFLIAVSLMYNVTGTLNMADLAVRAPLTSEGNVALLKVSALLLFLVFAIKAALAPMHWWLPTAYSAASAPAAALFAIMTKVGAYCIIRVYSLIFGADAGPVTHLAAPWIMPAAIATLVLGAIGALASRSLAGLIVFAVLWSMGTLLAALAGFDQAGLSAALYYAIHSTFAAAALFLIADLILERRGGVGALVTAPPMAQAVLMGAVFFAAAVSMSGMPPLSGFIGKLLVLDATRGAALGAWVWTAVLATSLAIIIAFARAGSLLFWKAETVAADARPAVVTSLPALACVLALVTMTGLLSVFAGPVTRHMDAAAAQALDRDAYVRAVLGRSPTQIAER